MPQLTQYGIAPPSLNPSTTSPSPRSTTPNGDFGRATATVAGPAGLAVTGEQRVEVDGDELVAVQRVHVAALLPQLRART